MRCPLKITILGLRTMDLKWYQIRFIAKNMVLTFLRGDIFIPENQTMSSIAEDKLW